MIPYFGGKGPADLAPFSACRVVQGAEYGAAEAVDMFMFSSNNNSSLVSSTYRMIAVVVDVLGNKAPPKASHEQRYIRVRTAYGSRIRIVMVDLTLII